MNQNHRVANIKTIDLRYQNNSTPPRQETVPQIVVSENKHITLRQEISLDGLWGHFKTQQISPITLEWKYLFDKKNKQKYLIPTEFDQAGICNCQLAMLKFDNYHPTKLNYNPIPIPNYHPAETINVHNSLCSVLSITSYFLVCNNILVWVIEDRTIFLCHLKFEHHPFGFMHNDVSTKSNLVIIFSCLIMKLQLRCELTVSSTRVNNSLCYIKHHFCSTVTLSMDPIRLFIKR